MIYVYPSCCEVPDVCAAVPAPAYEALGAAIEAAKDGECILVLEPSYPEAAGGRAVSAAELEAAKAKGLRLYVEYPASCGELALGAPEQRAYCRAVVTSEFFAAEKLSRDTILGLHDLWVRPVPRAVEALVASAHVAGCRKAVFGVEDAVPLLFVHPDYANVMVATTSFSHFRRGRFAPVPDWCAFWNALLAWLGAPARLSPWEPTVHVAFGEKSALPSGAEARALDLSMRWFKENMLTSDHRIMEGFQAAIDENGHQPRAVRMRGDCMGECAPVFAYRWKSRRSPEAKADCAAVLDRLFTDPSICCTDPANPCYGMLNFYESIPNYYGDDNCRAALGSILAAEWLGDGRWDKHILRCMLSVLRTTGPLGFRECCIVWPRFFPDGRNWDYFRDTPLEHLRPHSQGWMWAAFLVFYRLSGHKPFLELARRGIYALMAKFPYEITWTNGLSQEIARMMLPAAMLVEAEDTPGNRAVLEKVWSHLEPLLLECGGVREMLGERSRAWYPAPSSNQEYGTTEAPLIQDNGDSCCDLLYTTNYAFAGLNEAAQIPGYGTKFSAASDRLAEFLVRIQARSQAHPELSGSWLRGFDWRLWDYWGSSADVGWGAWSVESGWTNSWIAVTFALRQEKTGVYAAVTPNRMAGILPELLKEMSVVHPLPQVAASAPVARAPGAEN